MSAADPQTGQLIPGTQAARRLDKAPAVIRRWVASGRLRGELAGDRVFVAETDVAAMERGGSRRVRKNEAPGHGKGRR
jgi:hypothetical protein